VFTCLIIKASNQTVT